MQTETRPAGAALRYIKKRPRHRPAAAKVGLPPIWFGPRLVHGVPVGREYNYLDEGTLSAAINQRTLF
jgi:hypothetical protein